MNSKRALSGMLASAILFSSAPNVVMLDAAAVSTSVSDYTDLKGHWGETALRSAILNGLMTGRSETQVVPNGNITRAELAAVMVRAFGGGTSSSLNSFVDVEPNAWYYNELAKAVSLGFLTGSNNMLRPNDYITREEAATVIARAFGFTGGTKTDYAKFTDAWNVSSWASSYVGALVKRGYLNGSNSKLNPKSTITRAEFATMMYNIVKVYCNGEQLPAEQTITGNTLISKNITLSNKTINGDVFITDGVGSGSVTFNNVKVTGTVYIKSGGSNALQLTNGSSVTNVVIISNTSGVGVKTDENSLISSAVISNGTGSINLEGNINNITINSNTASVSFKKVSSDYVNVNKNNVTINIDSTSNIKTLDAGSVTSGMKLTTLAGIGTLNSSANASMVVLGGTIGTANISGSSVNVSTQKNSKISNLNLSCTSGKAELSGALSGLSMSNSKSFEVSFLSGFTLDEYRIGSNNSLFDGYTNSNVTIKSIIVDSTVSDFKFSGSVESITLESGAEKSKVTLSGGTVKNIVCNAKSANIISNSGSTVNKITVTASNVNISGQGKVSEVVASGEANYLRVYTKGTKVTNIDCDSVYANGQYVSKGSSVTTSGTGNGSSSGNDLEDDSNSGQGTYRLVFNSNNGTGETKSYNFIYGREVTLPDPDDYFSKSGYDGIGWAINSTDTIPKYTSGTTIKMPAYTTSLYAVWQKKDSGNSGDSTDDLTQKNKFTVKFPADAYPSDLDSSSKYTADTFAEGIVFEKIDDNNYTVRGTLNYVEGFTNNYTGGDGYYLPVALPIMGQTSSVMVYDCNEYSPILYDYNSINNSGIKYKGRTIAFVKIDANGRILTALENGSTDEKVKNFKITYNQDVTSASSLDFTITYDFSNLVFESNPDASQRIQGTLGAPSIIEGAQSKDKSSIVSSITATGYNSYLVKLSEDGITKNEYSGLNGYISGIRLRAPDGATKLMYGFGSVKNPATEGLLVDVNGIKYSDIYFTITDGNNYKNISTTYSFYWADEQGNRITPVEEMFIDFSELNIEGSTGKQAIASFRISEADDSEWVAEENSGNTYIDYVNNGYIEYSENSSLINSGTFSVKAVNGNYYIPLDFELKSESELELSLTTPYSGNGSIELEETSSGTYTGHKLLVLNKAHVESDGKASVWFVISCDGFDTTKARVDLQLSISKSFATAVDVTGHQGAINGKQVLDLVDSYELGNNIITANLKKVYNWAEMGDTGESYYLPFKLKVNPPKDADWYIEVNDKKYTKSNLSGNYITDVIKVGTVSSDTISTDNTMLSIRQYIDKGDGEFEVVDANTYLISPTFN